MIEVRSDLAAFFFEQLGAAQRATARRIAPEAEHYAVRLLVRLADHADEPPLHVPLVLQWKSALEARGQEARFLRFQEMGDSALVRSGLFPEEHEARGLRTDYFTGLGRTAYTEAANTAPTGLRRAGVFDALVDEFEALTRLLLELREQVRNDEDDLVRLAAAARRSGSPEACRRLANRGLLALEGDDQVH